MHRGVEKLFGAFLSTLKKSKGISYSGILCEVTFTYKNMKIFLFSCHILSPSLLTLSTHLLPMIPQGSLGVTLKEVKPTIFFGTPLIYEKIMEAMQVKLAEGRRIWKMIIKWAAKKGIEGNYNIQNGLVMITYDAAITVV